MQTRAVHIDSLVIGDVVLHDGRQLTLTRRNLTSDSFLGYRIEGDSYQLGSKPVYLVTNVNDEE